MYVAYDKVLAQSSSVFSFVVWYGTVNPANESICLILGTSQAKLEAMSRLIEFFLMHECLVWNNSCYRLAERLLGISLHDPQAIVDLLSPLLESSHKYEAATAMVVDYILSFESPRNDILSGQFLSCKVCSLLHERFPTEITFMIEQCFGVPGNIISLANRFRSTRVHSTSTDADDYHWNILRDWMYRCFENYLRNTSAEQLDYLQLYERSLTISMDTLVYLFGRRYRTENQMHVREFQDLFSQIVKELFKNNPGSLAEVPSMIEAMTILQREIASLPEW